MNLNPRTLLGLSVAATLALSGCSSDDDSAPAPAAQDVLSRLNALGLTTTATLIQDAGLATTLNDLVGGYTLLAPTNAAFAALPMATLTFLQDPANVLDLQALLNYHALAGEQDSTAVTALAGMNAPTLQTSNVIVDAVGTDLFINNARVSSADNTTSNGIVHIVDTVLRIPNESVSSSLTTEGFTTLVDLIGRSAGLAATIDAGNFTVLAPSDAAFAALMAPNDLTFYENNQTERDALLANHLIPATTNIASALVTAGDAAADGGQRLFVSFDSMTGAAVNGNAITSFNRPATGGLIHAIDGVITDPGDAIAVATAAGFATLVQEVDDAGLTATLQGAGPFTIFAPTDAAFTQFLVDNPTTTIFGVGQEAELADLLSYHVVADAIQSDELATLATVDTVFTGNAITITADMMGGITLSTNPGMGDNVDAPIATANVLANNAVIHVIDSVLLPPGFVLP